MDDATGKDAVKIAAVQKNTIVQIKAATGNWYKVMLPDETEGYLPANLVINIDLLRTITVNDNRALLDKPDSIASVKSMISKGSKVSVLGLFGNYNYVGMNDERGWLVNK